MPEILDLDVLSPAKKQIKLNGQLYDVNPPTVSQLIKLAKLQERLAEVTNGEEIPELLKEVLLPLVPQMLDGNGDIVFTPEQIKSVIAFALKAGIPEVPQDEKEHTDPKKKVSSPEELPISSDSTQDTPSDQSSTNTP